LACILARAPLVAAMGSKKSSRASEREPLVGVKPPPREAHAKEGRARHGAWGTRGGTGDGGDVERGRLSTTTSSTWSRAATYGAACMVLTACTVALVTSSVFPVDALPRSVQDAWSAMRGAQPGKDVEVRRELLASSVFADFCKSIGDDDACEDVKRLRAGLGAVEDSSFNALVSRARALKSGVDDSVEAGVGFLGAYDDVVTYMASKPRDVAKLVPQWSTASLGSLGDGPGSADFILAKKLSVFVADIFPLLRKYPDWDMSDTNQIRFLSRHMHDSVLTEESSREELVNFMRGSDRKSASLAKTERSMGILPPKNVHRKPPLSKFASNKVQHGAHLFRKHRSASLGSREFNPANEGLPDAFDAREEFPRCKRLLGTVRDQGKCGSCWAVAATEVMNDRLCVATRGEKTQELSPQYPLSCYSSGDRCNGGDVMDTMQAALEAGIPTGGMLDTGACLPYEFEPCDHPCMVPGTPVQSCPATCADGSKLELVYPKSNAYTCPEGDVACVAKEIQEHGSVGVTFGPVYEDFYSHKSGVYHAPKDGGDGLGMHATKLIGWGKTDEGEWYWIMVNSWRNWGDDGVGFVGMGEMQIESGIAAIEM